jgi:hypothetical protein
LFNQQKKYYTPELYNVFNQQTTNLFDTITTTNQFINEPLYFYSNNAYNALTSVEIDLPATAIPDEFTVNTFTQTLSNKTFSDNTTFQADITVNNTITCQYLNASRDITCVDLDASRDVNVSRDVNSVDFNGTGLLTLSDDTKEHIISNNLYIGRLFSATSNNYGIGIGGTTWTDINTNNTYVLSKNVSNNIVVLNSTAEVWTTINNQLRLKVTDQAVEFSPAGSLRFISNNASTRLYQTNNNSGADVFASDTNVYMDFFTQNKDYDVRLQFQRRDSGVGTGWFDCFAYRGRFWTGTQKMLEWGYINSANSFLMGAYGGTWIQFNTNSEIYYQVNNANRFTMAANGYHYATLHVNTSDRRLKSNIVDVSNALQTINTIEVKEFDKKCSMCCDEDVCEEELSHEIGFIAQQIEETDLSFCVASSLQNDTKGLKDSCIFALNVKATQELYAMVKQQQELLLKQQEEINILKEKLSFLNV